MSNKSSTKPSNKTFRLACIRGKIDTIFQSLALKLNERGSDDALVVEMVERMRPISTRPIQAVAPQPNNNPVPTPTPRPTPGPAPSTGDGSSQDEAVEIMDSEDELVHSMTLTPRREQRVRRQLRVWRDRQSSSSD